MKRSYVEHVAVRVKDIQWHIRFFREVLGMTVHEVDGSADAPKQIWTIGGGVKELAQGRNWLALPDGLEVELIQASGTSVAEALAVSPRAGK
jgi:catechol 2,3-dioxygenase-like lactoylglutathione lyase family enzyme